MGVKSAIRYDPTAGTNPVVLSWPANPGRAYQVKAAPRVDAAWEIVTPAPLLATSNLWSWRDAAGQGARFYQVVMLAGGAELNGQITDAVSGQPVAGVTVAAGGLSTTTDNAGFYALRGLVAGAVVADFKADAAAGQPPLTVHFQNLTRMNPQPVLVRGARPGYQAYTNSQVQLVGNVPTRLDFSLSPTNVAGLRLVLNWDAMPKDLDAHLVTPAIDGTVYEVSYLTSQKGRTNAPPYALFDVDRKDGFGPETITIARLFPGTYRYYAHNFMDEQGDTGPLRSSKAVVQIYGDQGLLQTLRVPTTGEGEYWDVCTIDGATGKITANDRIVGVRPSSVGRPAGGTNGTGGITRTIRASSSPPAVDYWWDFGDGTISREEHPVKIYSQPGVYSVQLTASVPGYQSGAEYKTNYIQVAEKLAITAQPQSVTATNGATVTLQVAAVGSAGLRYQWRKDGVDMAGQTNAVFTIQEAKTSDSGNYVVVVSGANGSVTSQAAVVAVFMLVPLTGMVGIPPGTFVLGSPVTEKDRSIWEGPQVTVTLTRAFWMGKCEVTQGEYQAVMGNNPSFFKGDTNLPVESVSWRDATNYCGKLTQQERQAGRLPPGFVYRLPTEAEWEYACRAGTTTRFSYGDDLNYTNLGQYAWYGANSGNTTHPVGQKKPNPWGLNDLHGNVWEWCLDWWKDSLPEGPVTDPKGPSTGSSRVDRGGGFADLGGICRSASRDSCAPQNFVYKFLGFRVVLAPSP